MDSPGISISVVYALADEQIVVALEVPIDTTVARAVELSGLSRRFPQIARTPLNCAIYGRAVDASLAVRDGDRVEILRPLLIDPKENRRQQAARVARSKPKT